ncbi:MAG: glycerol kinase GlpK [Rhodobacteraceae bacterium]|nr:glycerol kinase GlpK [Paracoccaceae bacterium]MCY4196196.1 glycerol kinase GlpK [Paracoccaceae bacterium]MCY4327592.1 glycerol kinase GlpK [Paracoccaceae bacterium]
MTGILAIDQGTTSSRAIIFDQELEPLTSGQNEFPQIYPRSGWVEHDPEAIWQTVMRSCRTALDQWGGSPVVIGITNQRETVIVWERQTGKPVYNAIVWQDRRTAETCDELREAGLESEITERTGLLLDPYFSASKLAWILRNVPNAGAEAACGNLLFGTVDSYLIWRLTGGQRHVTDVTNACRTMLVNLDTGQWDEDLLKQFDIPRIMLPDILECADEFGITDATIFGREIPILGVAGDQHAAAIGQACFEKGMLKSTYGTGCFALLNTGSERYTSRNRLLTTIAFRLRGQTHFALEGSIFVAGAVVQWMRDGLGLIENASETASLAAESDTEQQLYIVPAFTGLGAPYWDADCRGAVFGLTRNSGPKEFARAALESISYQTRDLIEAMKSDMPESDDIILRVDGGLANNDWAMQNLADQLGVPVDRPTVTETTARGAAYLAGLQSGLCAEPASFATSWRLERRFIPIIDDSVRNAGYAGWKDAVRRTLTQDRLPEVAGQHAIKESNCHG